MRWKPIITGPLLLSAACSGDVEHSTTAPTSGANGESPSATGSSTAQEPTTGARGLETPSSTSGGVAPGSGSDTADTDDTDGTGVSSAASRGDAPTTDTHDVELGGTGGDTPSQQMPDSSADTAPEPAAPEPADPESTAPESADPESTETAPQPSGPDAAPGSGQAESDPLEPAPVPVMGEPSNPGDPQAVDEAATQLSFAADIWPLWSMERDPVFVYRGMGSYTGCSDETAPCHGAANPGALLSMIDAETTYAQMLDSPSLSGICAGTQRVLVGDPDQSCLILFYEGRLGPLDLDWVDEAEIELMREWIRQGAAP